MSNKVTVYVVRHGETKWNTKKMIQGHKDSPLTNNGISQAKELAKELRKIKFDIIFSSDLLRAKRTAEIIAAERKLAVETTKLLRERTFGHLEGKTLGALKSFGNLEEIYRSKLYPDIESDEEIATRMITFLREAAIAHAGKRILVVTHGGIMKALLIKLGYNDYENPVWIKNAAYIHLATDGIDFEIRNIKGVEDVNEKRND